MLDKSLIFKNIIMRIDSHAVLNSCDPVLSDGLSFRFFSGTEDIKNWARIEAAVLEFNSEVEAAEYFEKSYVPHTDELENRCIFVVNQAGLPVATATAWFADSELGHQASLHWVAVHPDYQGLGTGSALVQKCLLIFRELEPGCDVWLHTQTWSHVAVRMYHKLGFNLMKTARLANMNTRNGITKIYENDFSQALEILQNVLTEKALLELTETAL